MKNDVKTYVFVLVDHIDSSGLKLAHGSEVSPHGSSDQNIIETISVDVASCDAISKICSDLISRQIVQIRQIVVVENNLIT